MRLPFGRPVSALVFATGVTAAITPFIAPVGEGGRRERLPACNRSLDGRERASEQQGGGKDDGGTSALFEDEPGGTAHDQNLRQRQRGVWRSA